MKKYSFLLILSFALFSTHAFADVWENALVENIKISLNGDKSFVFNVPGKKGLTEGEGTAPSVKEAWFPLMVGPHYQLVEKDEVNRMYDLLFYTFVNGNEVTIDVTEDHSHTRGTSYPAYTIDSISVKAKAKQPITEEAGLSRLKEEIPTVNKEITEPAEK